MEMTTILIIVIVLALVLFAVKLTYIMSTTLALPFTRGAVYVSTPRKNIAAFLDKVPMDSSMLLVDLGCGDGRVLLDAHRRYGVRAVGYELNMLAYLRAFFRTLRVRGITVKREDFWMADLSAVDIVFCYLYPDVMKKLADKVKQEMKPGAKLISCNFPLPGCENTDCIPPRRSMNKDPIYIYHF